MILLREKKIKKIIKKMSERTLKDCFTQGVQLLNKIEELNTNDPVYQVILSLKKVLHVEHLTYLHRSLFSLAYHSSNNHKYG
jgi:hypothetical protein